MEISIDRREISMAREADCTRTGLSSPERRGEGMSGKFHTRRKHHLPVLCSRPREDEEVFHLGSIEH